MDNPDDRTSPNEEGKDKRAKSGQEEGILIISDYGNVKGDEFKTDGGGDWSNWGGFG
jgi:hypothetical protein